MEWCIRSHLREEARDWQENQADTEPHDQPPGPVAHMHEHLNMMEIHYADSTNHAVSCDVVHLTLLVHSALREVEDKEDTETANKRVNVVEEDPENKTLAIAHFSAELVVFGHRNG